MGVETTRRFSDRQQTQLRVTSSFSNSATGLTYQSTTPWTITFKPSETVVYAGITGRLNVPGQGSVALDAGRVMYDWATGVPIFDAGPSEVLPNLCNLLAG